jgi:hypothetical protein
MKNNTYIKHILREPSVDGFLGWAMNTYASLKHPKRAATAAPKVTFSIKIILILSVLFLSFASDAVCEEYDFTYENETIIEDTTWSGTVFVGGVLTVFEKATLTIKPGTVVMFKKIDTMNDGFGENEMYIQGEIVAEGTKEQPILFTSAEKGPKPGDWIAINMMVSEGKRNIFKNCILEYSTRGFHAHFSTMNLIDCEVRKNFLAIQFQDSTVNIKGCYVHDNNQGIQFRDAFATIEDTRVINNEIGIRCVYSEVEFKNNEVTGCNMPAFQIRGSEVKITGSKLKNSKSGITAQDSDIKIKNSMVLNNFEDGLSLHNSDATIENNYIMLNGDDGILLENCTAVIRNNNIFNNAKYNIALDQEDSVDATHNYWGTHDIDMVHLFNYDKRDLSSLGEINVTDYYETEIEVLK